MTGGEPIVVDARNLRCPLPVIELAKAARDAPGGTLVTVLTTDPAARHDVPAWARLRGHALVSIDSLPDGDVLALTVRTGASRAAGHPQTQQNPAAGEALRGSADDGR